MEKCLWASWDSVRVWQTAALNHLIETEQYDAIFSHYHNVDGQAHQIMKFLKERPESKMSAETAMALLENVYEQTDAYIGGFMHLLDKGWTILVTSDHGQCCPEHMPCQIGESGDICIWIAEGYNYDHCDALSTVEGVGDTSMNSIFIAAGPGIKPGHTTERIIRQVDFAPTCAVLGGVRMPAQCEGAPVYQILAQ